MNWLDGGALLLVLGYTVLGFFSGMVRRVVGLLAIGLGLTVGTYLGLQTGGMIQSGLPWETPEARLAGFFSPIIIIAAIVEVLAIMNHDRLQFTVVAVNRASGAAIGLITAVVCCLLFNVLLDGYASPGQALPGTADQRRVADLENSSRLLSPASRAFGPMLYRFCSVALPRDPQEYFSSPTVPGPARAQVERS